jgi:hypothetical protein
VLGRESCLESLSLSYGQGTGALVAATMYALKTNTKLEQLLHIETIQGEILKSLLDGLPNISHLKYLSCNYLYISSHLDASGWLDRFETNWSVQSFVRLRDNIKDLDAKHLQRILGRNQLLQERFLTNPGLLPLSVWPFVLATVVSKQAGHHCAMDNDVLFRGMQCLVDPLQQGQSSTKVPE